MLVCFAVKEEARPFQRATRGRPGVNVLITGMGQRRATRAVAGAMSASLPPIVLTCGFAGGLRPELKSGTVIFDCEEQFPLRSALESAGAWPVRFHCADRVASTWVEKKKLFESTQADAVEMESGHIAKLCSESRIPCATVRVVLDEAADDLPVDFNLLMTPEQNLDYLALARELMGSP
jgi:adenosylhomocysteine nucleosidase